MVDETSTHFSWELTSRIGAASKSATVEAEDELPEINESTVESFSKEVRTTCQTKHSDSG